MTKQVELHIAKILSRKTPYEIDICGIKFLINNSHVYPPGKLTSMFATYIIESGFVKDNVIADIGAGCFALGIIAAEYGAKEVVGLDISDDAIACANENILRNNLEQKAKMVKGDCVVSLLPDYQGKADVVLAGLPWDTIEIKEYSSISETKQNLYRAFYDVENKLIKSVMTDGFLLLKPGCTDIFITSCARAIDRIRILCNMHNVTYKVVAEQDLHNDGNMHYILMLTRRTL